jgi:cyclase
MQQPENTLPTSEHFRLERLADGVYAAIDIEGQAAHSNAGIVDLGDRTLIFDAFLTPTAAEDLRAAAEHLTGRVATTVVNSHAHTDHCLGNQVFARMSSIRARMSSIRAHAAIISTHRTRETIATEVANFVNHAKADPTELEQQIKATQERLEAERDAHRRAAIEISIGTMGHLLGALPTLTLCVPNQTFDGKLVFHGTWRRAELLTYGSGHTSSDCFLVLPEERLAFAGDLAFFQSHPFMGSSDPQAWSEVLERLEQSDIDTFVPGHGPVGTKADISLVRQYVTALEQLAAQVVESGGSADDAARQPIPAPFDAWSSGVLRFERNMRFLHQRLSDQA